MDSPTHATTRAHVQGAPPHRTERRRGRLSHLERGTRPIEHREASVAESIPSTTREHSKMADQRPKFRNVEPRSRQERLANNDKEMLEKLRLEHRRGGAYRYNNPGNIIQPPEDSAAFMSEGERFGTNAAQEEYENRRRRILEREVRVRVEPYTL